MDSQNRDKRSSSAALKVGLLLILIISVVGVGSVGYIGYRYWEKEYKNSSSSNPAENQSRENTNTISGNFTSSEVFTSENRIVELVEQSAPAVVTVVSKTETSSLFGNTRESQGVGTGFFVSDDGLLITNEHVVCGARSSENLSVVTSENKSYDVESFVVDSVQDIAILKVNTKGDAVRALKFANINSELKPGQEVLAIGNPLGVNPGSVTRGIISGLDRNITAQGSCASQLTQKEYEGVIQTDAAINSGNSGGPLLNMNGEVIAVNSATSQGANNISYSVPFTRVVRLLERYQANNGQLTFPYLGVEYSMIDPNVAKANDVPVGAYVRRVVPGSPADLAGVEVDDIITKISDKSIEFSLQSTLNQFFEPGQKVGVQVYRPSEASAAIGANLSDGEYIDLELTIGTK